VCDEVLWPYDVSKFKNKPPSACYLDATNHKIKEYLRLETFNDTLACLAAGFPFVFGFKVYDSFMSSEVAKSGAAAMPLLNENSVGWHAVCAVGYDMEAKTVLMRNSWGEGWGRGGYFTLPFDYISNPELAQDFWTIRRVGKEKITFIKKLINFFKTLFKK
jgi:C1A family cysteine protease